LKERGNGLEDTTEKKENEDFVSKRREYKT
jgi:hypothetical protein